MANNSERIDVYLEIGRKRTFAGALEWPGWCKGARDEEGALRSLLECGPRYERVLSDTGLGFHAPGQVSTFTVAERLPGNATTDFGAPDIAPAADKAPVDSAELERLQIILEACWAALDSTAEAARGKSLRKGPRGGGRDLDGVVRHVMNAEAHYVARLGAKVPQQSPTDNSPLLGRALEERHRVILDALAAAARGEYPPLGPRSGARWLPRYFVRRDAWHILDHVWEIEDRAE